MLAVTVQACVGVSFAMFLKLATFFFMHMHSLGRNAVCHTSDRTYWKSTPIISLFSSMASRELKTKSIT